MSLSEHFSSTLKERTFCCRRLVMSYSYPPCDLSKILVILYYITKFLEWSTILLLAVKNSAWICFSAITFSIQLWPVKDSVQWRGVLLHKSFFKDIYYIPRCLLVTRFGCALLWAAPNHNLNNYWWPVSSPLSGGNLTGHILEVGTSSCHVLAMAHTKQVKYYFEILSKGAMSSDSTCPKVS